MSIKHLVVSLLLTLPLLSSQICSIKKLPETTNSVVLEEHCHSVVFMVLIRAFEGIYDKEGAEGLGAALQKVDADGYNTFGKYSRICYIQCMKAQDDKDRLHK